MPESFIKNKYIRSAAEWLITVAAAVVLFLIMRTFIFRLANVDGFSMEPTLKHGDMVLLSRISYIVSEPRQGDIVAFPFRENPSEHFIKRVIGIPGDEIDLPGNYFTVNGERLDDIFPGDAIIEFGDVRFPLTVGDGEYFVLGDNRNGSKDSRYGVVGCIPEKELIGKVVLRIWPPSRFGPAK